ncbi:MAG TPA: HD domain-containing phosphohydrolase [Candidatus Polarisedimenticolaceae bacterium]|nr:HD domain-containing phosphohydrolase [Candidatus Polarisedimenticolaceae bacterium]
MPSSAFHTSRETFQRRGRIALVLAAVLTLVGLAPLASVAWKLIDINREALKGSTQEYQLLLARSVARELDVHVQAFQTQVARVARALGPAAARDGSLRSSQVRAMLSELADDRIVYLRYADLQGHAVDSASGSRVPKNLQPLFLQGLREAAESVADHRADGPQVATASRPLLLEGDVPHAALVLSAPVVGGGAFRGVLSAVVDLQTVWGEVVRHYPSAHRIAAVDPRGVLFASTDGDGEPPGSDLSGVRLVQRFRSSLGRSIETRPFELQRQGKPVMHLGSYEVTAQGWAILVYAPEQEVYLPVSSMVQSTLFWAVGVFGLAILAAVALAGTLSTPLHRLASASRAFAAGNFSVRVQVRSRTEIGELADTFNRMASEIEDYIRRLKAAIEEKNELFLGTIKALAASIDAKDPYTRGHSARVNRYSLVLARQLRLSAQEIRDIDIASLLHDVGKIGVDDAILKKPGLLTPEEFEVMKTHTTRGAAIMAEIPKMKEILPGLRSHHERWKGGGYPDGLSGEQIPLMARIIAVADTFDAMTTDRPYQRAMTMEAAHARINQLKGVGLDERVVEAFNRAFLAGEIRSEATAGAVAAVG